MAKIHDFVRSASPVLIEPQDPASTALYLYGDKVDKQTLSPEFDGIHLIERSATTLDGFSAENTTHRMSQVITGKGYTFCSETRDTALGGQNTHFNFAYVSNLNPNVYATAGCTLEFDSATVYSSQPGDSADARILKVTSPEDAKSSLGSVTTANYNQTVAVPMDTINVDGRWIMGNAANSGYFYPNYTFFYYRLSDNSVPLTSNQFGNYVFPQIFGQSNIDEKAVFFIENLQGGSNVILNKRLNVSDNAIATTDLLSFSVSSVPAAGTDSGGVVTSYTTAYEYRPLASQYMDDPRDVSGNTKLSYIVRFDSANNYHPLVATWDTSADTFDIEVAQNITGTLSSEIANYVGHTSVNGPYCSIAIINEIIEAEGNKYVAVFLETNISRRYTTIAEARTLFVYQIDPLNPLNLTFHSSTVIPDTTLSHFWLNDSKSQLAILSENATFIYNFTDALGFTKTSTLQGKMYGIGRDYLDRIWYTTDSSNFGDSKPELHLLTPTVPITITIAPELDDYTYAGSTISSYIEVSAYNISGQRIQTEIKLIIEGSGMVFGDGSTVKTVTSLTAGELQVPINVTSAGYSNITASVNV
jgi:hypothetical protein